MDMKKMMNLVSDRLYAEIEAYGDTTEYVNKKADFADALGFVAAKMAYGYDQEKWTLVGRLIAEYQETIDQYHIEALV